ncbi:NAD(P)/FAD-dependent oxidoreductase [Williamsia maris]
MDVVIVGAGLSGVGAAHHVREAFPDGSHVVLESRERIGGTWDLFRYPGVRCDSDMQSLSYRFRPWSSSDSIVSGADIREYIEQTAVEDGTDARIRFGHKVIRADYATETATWTVVALRGHTAVEFTCRFLYLCTGYYDYDRGHTPDLPGSAEFTGPVVHPQQWPDDLDHTGKRVVVIGSGATAITLVPALAETAAHVVMLQRSPTYVMAFPRRDTLDEKLGRVIGPRRAAGLTRWKNIAIDTALYHSCRRWPTYMRSVIRKENASQLPDDFDIDRHFTPRYDPWDQRMCLAPDGDIFAALSDGRASIVTDKIDQITSEGVALASGEHLDADIIVTATGLQMLAFGAIDIAVDGAAVSPSETLTYKGMMLSGVPNLLFTIGYTNASWTLKADLVGEHFRRMVAHMDARGFDQFVPVRPEGMAEEPLLDCEANYILRSIDTFPRAGTKSPWQLGMSYFHDIVALRYARLGDPAMRFARSARASGRTGSVPS